MAKKQTIKELEQRVKELEIEVSKRKRAQEGLRESEERLKTVVNNVNDVIFQVSPSGFIQYVSPKVEEIYGYNPEELIGKHLRKTTPVSEVPKALEALKRVLSGKTVKNLEINQLDSRGKIIPMEINVTPVKKGGKIIAAQGVMRDISERKRAEEALRKAHDELERRVEERTAELKKANEGLQTEITGRKQVEEALRVLVLAWQTLFDAVTDSVFLIDSEGKILLCNKATANFLGKPINEIVGNTCWELVHGTSEPIKGCPIVRMRETRHSESLELPVGDRVFYVATHPILDQDGNIARAVHIITDITERKRAEKELRDSREQLRNNLSGHLHFVREAERTLIAGEIHDDLGQSLTALKMDISWLAKKLPKDQKPLLEKLEAMAKLTSATLKTVRRISTELRPSLLDHLGLVAAIEWQAEEFQNRTGIRYKITIDPEDITLDEKRSTSIFRIFQKTLTNVARHARATRVGVSLKEKAGTLELKVRDNGNGITKKQISDRRSFGLLEMRERANALAGEMEIKGAKGKGTIVMVRIPIEKEQKFDDKDIHS